MRGDTICTDRFVQHCLDTETYQQKWVRYVIRQSHDHRVIGQSPVVRISEGFGITTYAYHAGGGVHTMTTKEWEACPVYYGRRT